MYPFERTVPPLSPVVPMYPLDTFYTYFVSDGYKNHDAGSLARFLNSPRIFTVSFSDFAGVMRCNPKYEPVSHPLGPYLTNMIKYVSFCTKRIQGVHSAKDELCTLLNELYPLCPQLYPCIHWIHFIHILYLMDTKTTTQARSLDFSHS